MNSTASPQTVRSERWLNIAWILFFAVASSAWCTLAATRLSGTFDEATYIELGLKYWQTGRHSPLLRLGTSPLPIDVQTLPLYIGEQFRPEPWNFVVDYGKMLRIARTTNLVFWWWLLLATFLLANRLGGSWAGRLAVAGIACEPNMLAHATLATTDIAITAALVSFAVVYAAGRNGNWRERVLFPGIMYGLALLCKASALVFGPIIMVAIELQQAWSSSDGLSLLFRQRLLGLRQLTKQFLCIGLIGFGVMLLGCGCDFEVERSFVKWARELPDGTGKTILLGISEHLWIFSNAGEVIVQQIKHNVRGHGQFLLGESSLQPFWYYFPVLFTIKLPIALLLGAALVLLIRWKEYRANWPLIAVVMLGIFSLNCRVQIGIRLQLLLVVLMVIAIATAISRFPRPQLARATAFAGIGWMAFASLTVWPHGLCYVNELWGGTAHGNQLVSDSNYDWGQGLKELKRWHAKHDVPLSIWYFGTDPSVGHMDVSELRLQDVRIDDPAQMYALVHGKYLAVSTTMRAGPPLNENWTKMIAFLDCCKPVDRTTTFLIYDFTEPRLSSAAGATKP